MEVGPILYPIPRKTAHTRWASCFPQTAGRVTGTAPQSCAPGRNLEGNAHVIVLGVSKRSSAKPEVAARFHVAILRKVPRKAARDDARKAL